MRILIATTAGLLLTVAAATSMALHKTPAKPPTLAIASQGVPATRAAPGLVWHSGKATLRLTDRPCPFIELSSQLEIEGSSPPRAYTVQQGDHASIGCWTTDAGGDVMTLEPGRDGGQIPIDWFRVERRT